MKKRILTIILMVSVVAVGLFAGVQQRAYYQDGTQLGLNSNPTYVELADGTYRNTETNQIVSESELPDYCRLVGGDGQLLNQRNQNNDCIGNCYNDNQFRSSSNSKRQSSSNSSKRVSQSSRNFRNR